MLSTYVQYSTPVVAVLHICNPFMYIWIQHFSRLWMGSQTEIQMNLIYCNQFLLYIYYHTINSCLFYVKGTVSRDFSCPVFFIKHLLLVQIGMPRTDFKFLRILVELFVFVIDSPAMNTPGIRLESFRFGSFCKHKSHVPRELK